MRVGLVVPGFAAGPADWCLPALTNLARALAARPGVDLHVYTLRYPPRRGCYPLRGATVEAFGAAPIAGRHIRGASLALLWAQFLAAVRAEHARAPFAVLHGFWATEPGYLAALAGRLLGIPTLVHLAGGELTADRASGYGNRRPGLARLLVALSLRLATGITVPSGPLRRQLQAHYPRDAAKALPWAFGVDTDLFTPPSPTQEQSALRTPHSALRLVQVASLVPVKNQALLLEGLAAAQVGRPPGSITATLVGQGPLAGALRAQIARLGLGRVVSLAGEHRHDTLPDLYRAHDLFVLTSRHEAQCLAVLEAAACGLPWAGPPVGALADLAAREPPSGWPLAEAGPAALAGAIRAAADPAARAARGRAARALVARDYALEPQTDRLLALYRQVGERSPRRPLLLRPPRR